MMQSLSMANRFREILLDGDWVAGTNYKEQLSDVTWQQATTKVGSLNTIALLTFHMHYYIAGVLNVFEGGNLEIKDMYSFDAPPITNQKEWEVLLDSLWKDSIRFADAVEVMSDDLLRQDFTDPKYGSYHRNIDSMIEHAYYHLGQIVLLKKLTAK